MTRAATLMLLLILQAGCSTRPRDFKPNIAVAPVNQDVGMRDFAVCKMMVDRGIRGNYAQQAIALTPVTAGATAGFAASFAAGIAAAGQVTANAVVTLGTGGLVTPTTTAASASTTLTTVVPILGAAASVAIAAGVKKGNEKKVKRALGSCMQQYGHEVATWQVDRSKTPELPAELPRDPVNFDK